MFAVLEARVSHSCLSRRSMLHAVNNHLQATKQVNTVFAVRSLQLNSDGVCVTARL
jgi:hypothetical protein